MTTVPLKTQARRLNKAATDLLAPPMSPHSPSLTSQQRGSVAPKAIGRQCDPSLKEVEQRHDIQNHRPSRELAKIHLLLAAHQMVSLWYRPAIIVPNHLISGLSLH